MSENKILPCPVCLKELETLDFITASESLRLSPTKSRLLEALWFGEKWDARAFEVREFSGSNVPIQTLVDSMYRDKDVGVDSTAANRTKAVKWHVHFLRGELSGTGIDIESVRSSTQKGYRITFDPKFKIV